MYTATKDVGIDASENVNSDLETMTQNIKSARGSLNAIQYGKFELQEGLGLSNSAGLMINDNGQFNVLGKTEPPNFLTGKIKILYSTKAASNFKILGRVMSHETSHAISFAFGLPDMEIDSNLRFDNALDSVHHLVIRNLEHTYAFKNNIIPGTDYVLKEYIKFQINTLNSSQRILYNFIYKKFYNIFNIGYKF